MLLYQLSAERTAVIHACAPDLSTLHLQIGIARVFSLVQTLVLASKQHRAMVRKLIVV
jgi:hypothetical protein